jgi:hypothetical protein
MREGRVANVALSRELGGAVPAPWRMWTANGGPLHIKDPRR